MQATPLAVSPVESSHEPERRLQPRHRINSIVYLDVERDNGGVLLDLSEGGMCISVAKPLVKASTIHFSLRLQETWRIDGTGRVSWVSASGKSAGVNFLDLPASSRQWILRGLGETNPAGKIESSEIGREVPQASATPERPTVTPTLTESPMARSGISPPAVPAKMEREDSIPSAAAQPSPSAPSPTPVVVMPLGPSEVPTEPVPAQGKSGGAVSIPETPLFFLFPPKPKSEVCSALDSRAEEQALQEPDQPSDAGLKPVFQPALDGKRSSAEHGNKSPFLRDVLFTMAVVGTVLAIGIVLIFYAGGAHGYANFTVRNGQENGTPSADENGAGRPARNSRAMIAENHGEERFPVEVADSFGMRWIVTAVGRMPIVSESPSVAAPDHGLWGSRPEEKQSASGASTTQDAGARMTTGKPIVVEAWVGRDGGVEFVQLLGSPTSPLARSLADAVQHWRYRPLRRHGQPVPFVTRIRFEFPVSNGNFR